MSSGDEAWVSLVIGLLLALVSVIFGFMALRSVYLRRIWTVTEAKVINHQKRRTTQTTDYGTTTSTHLVAQYRFADASGQQRHGTDETGTKRAKGSTVTVMYDPQDPSRNETVSIGRTNTVVVVVLALLLPLTLYAIQWGLAGVLGVEPPVTLRDPRLLWLDEEDIQR